MLPSIGTPEQLETRRVNPLLALFVELDSLNVTLLRVLEALEATRPQGRIFSIARTVSGQTISEVLNPLWFSFHLVNDGPNDLYFAVNNLDQPLARLPRHETLDVDMVEATISALIFRVNDGETANFRVYGVY